jgi:hypothetical protein
VRSLDLASVEDATTSPEVFRGRFENGPTASESGELDLAPRAPGSVPRGRASAGGGL